MKRVVILYLLLATVPTVHAEVSTQVFMADGTTPLPLVDPYIPYVYRPIMAGTQLSIVISSNSGDFWGGALTIWDSNQNYGILHGVEILPAAGESSLADPLKGIQTVDGIDHDTNGFQFSTDPVTAVPGDWFVVDYNAIAIGSCNVLFFDPNVDFEHPIYQLSFTHVRTRDFDNDGIVNLQDFAVISQNWRRTDCVSNGNCSGSDLEEVPDGDIDFMDLDLFTDYWLERTR